MQKKKKAREEISNVISDVEEFSMEQLNDLLYTNTFIKESLRLFTQIERVPTKDYKFGNVSIPKGAMIMIPSLYIPKNDFEKRKEFTPERCLNGMVHLLTVTVNYIVF